MAENRIRQNALAARETQADSSVSDGVRELSGGIFPLPVTDAGMYITHVAVSFFQGGNPGGRREYS
jgi:hypothetical protein